MISQHQVLLTRSLLAGSLCRNSEGRNSGGPRTPRRVRSASFLPLLTLYGFAMRNVLSKPCAIEATERY